MLHLINKITIMKNIYKFLILTFVASTTMFYSCETTELELLENPTALTQADPDLLLNNIQLNFRTSAITFNNIGARLGRIDNMFGRNYFNNFGSGTVGGPWNDLYSDIMPDIAAIEAAHSADNDLSFHLGTSKLMQAVIMLNLVDTLGDIVWSEANKPEEFPSPMLDDDAAVYAAALDLIAEAKGYLNGASVGTATDLFYGGDASKWIKYANTILMRADLTQGNYTAVINASNVISSTADDLEFTYGTNELSPDNRHPSYIGDYRSDGANTYMSNWMMQLMTGDYGDFNAPTGRPEPDPRRRFYYYRQNWATPGNYNLYSSGGSVFLYTADTNGETLQCSLQTTPSHLQFTPQEPYWCSVQMGYWGREHGNDEGTPPDNFTRTASGVYPAGGSFDDNPDVFEYTGTFPNYDDNFVAQGAGGGGAGIEPIMLASFVDFYMAEAHLALGNTGPAATYLEAGITKSIAKVQSFGALDGAADSAELASAMDAGRISSFIASVIADFNAAPMSSALDGTGWPVEKDKMDILGEQLAVAQFGAGGDMFNFIRRTGYPRTLSRSLEGAPGTFPRTVLYPGGEVSANPNILQRTDLNDQVFWDTGVTNPAN